MKFKFSIIIVLMLIGSWVTTVGSLKRAIEKPFWGDEINEIFECLSWNTYSMLKDGITGTASGSPFYYILERQAVRYVLNKEKNDGQGYDWRISLRLLPTLSMVFFAFVAGLLFIRSYPLVSIAIPAFLVRCFFATNYGAETRTYATWMGISLLFFASTALFCLIENFWLRFIWLISCWLMTFTLITSPLVVGAIFAAIFVVSHFKFKKLDLPWIIAGFVGTSLLFLHYRQVWIHNHGPSFANFLQSIPSVMTIVNYFVDALDTKFKALIFAVETLLLYVAGAGYLGNFTESKNLRLYKAVAIISLSQIFAALFIICFHFASLYFIHPRHIIFITAAKILVTSVALDMYVRFAVSKFKSWQKAVTAAIIFASFLPWFVKGLLPTFKGQREILSLKTTYCHGGFHSPIKDEFELFNILNRVRHTSQCEEKGDNSKKDYFDYSPEWIYGPSSVSTGIR